MQCAQACIDSLSSGEIDHSALQIRESHENETSRLKHANKLNSRD